MDNIITENDKKFIRRCIELSDIAVSNGDAPFGAVIVKDNKIISEGINNSKNKTSDHAETIALHNAHIKLGTQDLSSCTLYSNCEPCPMCSFMAREYKVDKVIFAMPSPFFGGYAKWPILQDTEISKFKPFFKEPPIVISGVLENEAKKYSIKLRYGCLGVMLRKIFKTITYIIIIYFI